MRGAGLQRWTRNFILGLLLIGVVSFALGKTHQKEKPNPQLAAYQKQVTDIIGPRWYAYTENQRDKIVVGKVTISFRILADGKVTKLKIIRNTSNEALATVSVKAVLEAKFPPIPESVRSQIHQDFIDWDEMNFIMYPN